MKKNNKGFTLIELIVVIVIIGILLATSNVYIAVSSDARQAANNFETQMSNCRTATISGKSNPILELVKEDDKFYGLIKIEDDDGNLENWSKLDLNGERAEVSIDYAGSSTKTWNASTAPIKIQFDKETGAFKWDSGANEIESISFSSGGGTFRIDLTNSTGYFEMVAE